MPIVVVMMLLLALSLGVLCRMEGIEWFIGVYEKITPNVIRILGLSFLVFKYLVE